MVICHCNEEVTVRMLLCQLIRSHFSVLNLDFHIGSRGVMGAFTSSGLLLIVLGTMRVQYIPHIHVKDHCATSRCVSKLEIEHKFHNYNLAEPPMCRIYMGLFF